ncbi:hypothetical protein LSAT2_006305 [Lamellibrachia satsuma]|nr:hypothetical protein LSAT2_006305 [Lamellibrachia satsuma]
MLLAVSTTFVLLNLPSHAIRVHSFIVGLIDSTYRPSRELLVLQEVSTLVYYCNFAVNFFLYSLCGDNFRKALWSLGTKCRYRADRRSYCQRYKMTATSTFVSNVQDTSTAVEL